MTSLHLVHTAVYGRYCMCVCVHVCMCACWCVRVYLCVCARAYACERVLTSLHLYRYCRLWLSWHRPCTFTQRGLGGEYFVDEVPLHERSELTLSQMLEETAAEEEEAVRIKQEMQRMLEDLEREMRRF